MDKKIKNPFERKQKGAVIALCLLCTLFSALTNCEKPVSQVSQEIPWVVKLKLKPQTDESYLPTEDPEIKTLLSKHDVTMTQTMPPGPRSIPELLSYYDIRGKGSMSKKSKENCIADFLATGKFEDEVFEYGISHTN
jgi:hypothetical protein